MSEVRIWILLGNELVLVPAQPDHSLAGFYMALRENYDVADLIPARMSYRTCGFYRLKSPVFALRGGNEDAIDSVKQACMEESNREAVDPRERVRYLATTFSGDHVYLVIDFPDPLAESNKAIQRLMQEDHVALFECLAVTTRMLGSWSPGDVEMNLQGGILTSNVNDLPPEFKEVQGALGRKRVYQENDGQERDLQNAQSYGTHFDRVFAPANTGPHTVTNGREFASFYNVLRCYHGDMSMIASESSSTLKASNFTVHFVQPPFFVEGDNSRGFKYHQEKSWDFPVFVDTTSARNVRRKFTPRNDWMVIAPSHKIPFVISEVISQKERDRSRMLVEAIALARTGNFLLKSTSERTFFVVAIYVAADMTASRYIIMQTGRGNANHTNNLYRDKVVCIHRKDFNLTESQEKVDFLCEMYNLATEVTALSGDLDQFKEKNLTNVKTVASKVLSLSSPNPPPRMSRSVSGSTTMDTTTEEFDDEDDLGVFEREDIQDILRQTDYKVEFIPWGHPHLAVIVNKNGDEHGYLKFVERDREISVLRYLTEIESPSNYTISGVRFWPVEGGTVISMHVAGGWLTSLRKPGEQLWSVALQFFEAVGFMHGENVAHMDLKPQNVIIPAEGGRLSIIDFSLSMRVRGPDVKCTGIVGTEGYMAPEVRKGCYKPMLADLWSCGKTLKELCLLCDSSADRTTVLEIARKLMDRDPEARPKMSTVLEWMATARRGQDNVVSPVSGLFPVVSPLSA